jgi:tetratricopeptide (TPR) repeat protein
MPYLDATTRPAAAAWLVALAFAFPLAAQDGPAAFPREVERAEALLREERWSDAARAWEAVTRKHPLSGRYWSGLAAAATAAGDLPLAERAVEGFVGTGGTARRDTQFYARATPASWAYRIAQLHARAGDRTRALHWLGRSLELKLPTRAPIAADSAFAALRSDPEFQRLAGIGAGPGATREARWRSDIDLFLAELRRVHPAPFRATGEARLRSAADALAARVGSLTEDRAVVEFQRLARLVGDGHTTFVPEGYAGWRGTLPLQFESEGDAVYVVAADSAHAELVGGRVVEVGTHPAAAVIAALDSLASLDNVSGLYRTRQRNLRLPQLVAALGFTPDRERLRLAVRHDDGRTVTRTVAAVPERPTYRRTAGDPSWVHLFRGPRSETPLYLQDRSTTFWFRHVAADRLVYAAINNVSDGREESFGAWSRRMLAFADSVGAERLVLDVRWNNGGNSLLLPPLIHGLIGSRFNRHGRLFLLTSRHTYSAAVNLTTFVERHTEVVIIGEPPASDPNFVGESNLFVLPATGLPVSVSNLHWQSSWPMDRRRWTSPSVYVPLLVADERAGHDAALEVVRVFPPTG